MTGKAEQHLIAARALVAKGEEFYRKAGAEIIAAQKSDHTLSNGEIGEWFGHTESWVRRIVASVTSSSYTAPFAEESGQVAKRHAKAVLKDASPAEIAEQFLIDPDVRQKVERAQVIASVESTRRAQEIKARDNETFREAIGPNVAADLAFTQQLRDTEYELVRARGALAGFLKGANALDGQIPEAWTTSCESWLTDISEKVELCRGLLSGADLDDAIDRILAEVE